MIVNGYELEYIHESHMYIVDGVIVPSVTQILDCKFGKKYDFVSPQVLRRAAEKGTAVHEAIEQFERYGTESALKELRNYKFLKKAYGFECLESEIPVILFKNGDPVAAGRLDMVVAMNDKTGLADIKRTSALDKNYLAYQLNMYRIAYQQSYGVQIDFLRGIHLREDTRRFVDIPIKENIVWEVLEEWQTMKQEMKK